MINISTNENRINRQIRAVLLEQGVTLTDWAIGKDFQPRTVFQTLWRFAGADKRPRRGIALSIVEQLESETGVKICGQGK